MVIAVVTAVRASLDHTIQGFLTTSWPRAILFVVWSPRHLLSILLSSRIGSMTANISTEVFEDFIAFATIKRTFLSASMAPE